MGSDAFGGDAGVGGEGGVGYGGGSSIPTRLPSPSPRPLIRLCPAREQLLFGQRPGRKRWPRWSGWKRHRRQWRHRRHRRRSLRWWERRISHVWLRQQWAEVLAEGSGGGLYDNGAASFTGVTVNFTNNQVSGGSGGGGGGGGNDAFGGFGGAGADGPGGNGGKPPPATAVTPILTASGAGAGSTSTNRGHWF